MLKNKKLLLLSKIAEFLLGLNCGYPIRDVILYVLWLKGHYYLSRFPLCDSHFFICHNIWVSLEKKHLFIIRDPSNDTVLSLDEVALLFWLDSHFMLTDEAFALCREERNCFIKGFLKKPVPLPFTHVVSATLFWGEA
jgi:hypothetical protein